MDTNALLVAQASDATWAGLGHISDLTGGSDWRNEATDYLPGTSPGQFTANLELPYDTRDFEGQLSTAAPAIGYQRSPEELAANNAISLKSPNLHDPADFSTADRVTNEQTIDSLSAIARQHLLASVEAQALAQGQFVQDVPTFIASEEVASEKPTLATPAAERQTQTAPDPDTAIAAALIQPASAEVSVSPGLTAAALTTTETTQHIFGLDVLDFYDPRAAQAIVDLGVKWVRIDFNRSYIEPTSRTYSWSDYDTFMLKMQKAGVQVLAEVTSTPSWIGWSNWTAQYADATRFFTDIVNRYKPGGLVGQAAGWGSYGITRWELFNEPNLAGYGWLNYGSNAMAAVNNYAKVISLADDAVHLAAPGAKTLLGGLSSEGRPDQFLSALYTAGAKTSFDYMAFHPYGWDNRFQQLATSITQFMGQYGDATKPIWYDEYGTADQSQQIALLQSAWAQRNTVDALFWFNLKDINTTDQRYGLVDSNYNPKPIYSVFKSLMQSA